MSSDYSCSNVSDSSTPLAGFEGPEKLIEIWFANARLRAVDLSVWEAMLSLVKCQILSSVHNQFCDAYLLSESSLFVYDDRLVLKTCGTTTLLHAVPEMIKIAKTTGDCAIQAFFYSRKSFLYPDRQEWPHGKWEDEVGYLDDMFPSNAFEASGYVLGKINGNHWCLYIATPGGIDCNGDALDSTVAASEVEQDDITIEILMTNLDTEKMKKFWRTPQELEQAKMAKNSSAKKHTFLGQQNRLYVFSF